MSSSLRGMAAYVALMDPRNPVIIDRRMVCHIADSDKANAGAINKLIELYNGASITWSWSQRLDVFGALERGEFKIADSSTVTDPKEHPVYSKVMRRVRVFRRFPEPYEATPDVSFSEWFILAGIYGADHEALRQVRRWTEHHLGTSVDADLRIHNSPYMSIMNTDQEKGIEKMVYQLIQDCTELKATVKNLQEQNDRLQKQVKDLEQIQQQQGDTHEKVEDTLVAVAAALRGLTG